MSVNRSYRYLIKPNAEQKKTIARIITSVNFLRNRYLKDEEDGKDMNRPVKELFAEFRRRYPFLISTDPSALTNMMFQMRGKRRKSSRKKDCNRSSYTTGNYCDRIWLTERSLHLPLVGDVQIVYHRPLPEDAVIKTVTVSRNYLGEYYASLMFECPSVPVRCDLDIRNAVGLDYSSPHLYVDDHNQRIGIPHFYREREKQIRLAQQRLSRAQMHSANWYKRKNELDHLYQKVANRRTDYLHKLSTDMSNRYDIICVEDLSLEWISRRRNLGKATYDNAYATFVKMLQYKMEDRGKKLIMVDRYFPSSKTCHVCGCVNKDLTLNDKVWKCPMCGTILDRDHNAAINIRNEGIRIYKSAVG